MDVNGCEVCYILGDSDEMTEKTETESKNNVNADMGEAIDENDASEARRICIKLPKKQADEVKGIKETLGIEYNRLFEMAVLDPEKYSIYRETAHRLSELETKREVKEKKLVEE